MSLGSRTYDPQQLRAVIASMVRWRWPRERLLLVVPCEAEWELGISPWGSPTEGSASWPPNAATRWFEPGALGVTEARLVYHGQERPGLLLRISYVLLAFVSVAGLVSGEIDLALSAGAFAAAAWLTARGVEALGLGGGSVEFGRIVSIERGQARILGVDRWGTLYRLHLREPALERVVRLLPLTP